MDANFFNRLHRSKQTHLAPRSPLPAPRRAFTLVELLVVITIIGILASLITVAAVGAIKHSRRTRIKTEINEIASGFDEVKNKTTAYPPNCQTDGTGPISEADVFSDLRRHIKQIASRSQETDDLVRALTGQVVSDSASYPRILAGGIAAPEAIVFWLGGFSQDPKYPISVDGGPSYAIPGPGVSTNRTLDPVASRTWVYPCEVTRLGPRASDGYFDESSSVGARFIEYKAPNGTWRRINFWQYMPSNSKEPYVYFDTSRHPVGTVKSAGSPLVGAYDPPAATASIGNGNLSNVYAFKKALDAAAPNTAPQIQFINPDKFQVFHCGIDDAWDNASFLSMAPGAGKPNDASQFLLFPTGPFVGDFAGTEVNFITQTTIEDAQK